MAYQSFFKNNGSTATAEKGSGYQSFHGLAVDRGPTKQQLTEFRKRRKAGEKAAKLQQEIDQEKQANDNKLINKIGRGAKTVGNAAVQSQRTAATAVARSLPGGTADIDAQTKAADQAAKDTKYIKDLQKSGKMKPETAKKLLIDQAKTASQASKEVSKTVKAMPTTGQVAAGFAGTAADIASAGTFSALKVGKTANTLTKTQKATKTAKKVAPAATANAASGGFNAAAGGGDSKTVATNAAIGALFPIALGKSAAMTTKALDDTMSKVKAPKKLLEEQKRQTLLNKASQETAEKNKVLAAKVDQKIELIEAKKADGKFTNVDKVKVKQLKAERQALGNEAPLVKPDIPEKPVTGMADSTSKTVDIPVKTDAGVPATPKAAIPDTAKPAPTQTPIKTAPSKESIAEAPEPIATRTLKPSETSHMSEIGGYTHSNQMVKDYADMLRGQEQAAKGGQMIKNADGSYRRISEHSRFYRDFYADTGKAPTKADYMEQAKKELETGKDSMGAANDYIKLLEREAKPVPRVQVESTVKDVPQGTSKVGDTALENAVGKSLKKKYGEAAQYDKLTIADQAKKAVKLTEDRELLEKVIAGDAPLPDGLRATALIDAIERHPVLGKDTDLLVKLSKSKLASESSYSAQELRLAAERVESSPIEAMKKIRAVREKAAEKRLGKSVKQAVASELQQIRKTQPKIRPSDWNSLIESLKC